MNFLKIIFWEYIQNLPVLAGFAWAFDLWQRGQPWIAFACVAAGGLTGAILIALTEARKQAGYKEPRAVLLTNIVSITTIMFVMMIYLTVRWSSWLTDLMIGVFSGIGLGIAQSLAARKKINVLHCIALGVASPLVLICIRWLLNTGWSIWIIISLICLLATLIISFIDYAPDEFNPI
jgi:hypothetical protein